MLVFHGSNEEFRNFVQLISDVLTGKEEDIGVASMVLMAIGYAALADISDAYITKSRGGIDAMGIQWPDIKPETLAYGRPGGPGDPKMPNISPHRPSLTEGQDRLWRQVFVRQLIRLEISLPEAEAKSRAAQIAWGAVKAIGAKTKLELWGFRQHEILRDTGVLLNSLTPGILTQDGYEPPQLEGGDEQIFEVNPGVVIIGSDVAYAAAHNFGIEGKLPRRQFLPDEEKPVPALWWDNWIDAGVQALTAAVERIIREEY